MRIKESIMTNKKKKSDKVLKENGKVKVIKFYDRLLATALMKDNSLRGIFRNNNFYIDNKAMYSGRNKITQVYVITGYESSIPVDYHYFLRLECKGDVRINFIDDIQPNKIDWDSSKVKNKMTVWNNQSRELEERNDGSIDKAKDLIASDKNEMIHASVDYLTTADLRRQRSMFRIRTLMLVSGTRGEQYDSTCRSITEKAKALGLKITRVLYDIPNFISTFSPFSDTVDKSVMTAASNTSLTDEILARFFTYTAGKLGIRGVYFGVDIESGRFVLKTNKSTSDKAENWLVTAETGGGKSAFMKVILGQFLGDPQYLVTIMDIEGNEYNEWYRLLKYDGVEEAIVLNMAEGSGSYFDPVEINLTGDAELDEDMLSLSKSFTLSMFKTIAGDTIDESPWCSIIIDDGVAAAYKSFGVREDDRNTWERQSKGHTLHDVYNIMKELVPRNEQEEAAKSLVIAKLGVYFEKDGSRAQTFSHRIPLLSIVYAKLVICSFGMRGKSQNSVDTVQLALMQMCAAHISHLRSLFGKLLGRYSVKLWEEFQRWGKFPGSDKTLGVALTGGRKLGDINIIITNLLKELLENDVMGILDNITTFAIGGINNSDTRASVCEKYSIQHLRGTLDMIAKGNKDVSAYNEGDVQPDNGYSHSFIIGLDMVKIAPVRMEIPGYMYRTELFGTFVDTDKVKEEQIEEEEDLW